MREPVTPTAHQLRLYHRLQLAAHLVKKRADRAVFAASGLTVTQISALTAVDSVSNPTQREVAELLGVNEAAIAEMVKRLIASGHLRRSRSRSDGRAWTLVLSDSGRRALSAARPAFTPTNTAIDERFSPSEIQALARSLDRVIERFSEHRVDAAPNRLIRDRRAPPQRHLARSRKP
jgi:DNA-binding MarR family transcriptional regulator